MKQHFVTCWKLQKKMEVETVVENPDGDFKKPKKAVKRKIAEAEKVNCSYRDVFLILVFQEAVMDTESDTGVSDVDSVVSSVTAPLRPAFPPIKKEKLADGSEVLSQDVWLFQIIALMIYHFWSVFLT